MILFIGGESVTDEMLSEEKSLFRSNYIKLNPVLQAIYFDLIVTNFTKYLLGYNEINKERSTSIIGQIESFYRMVETQGRGSLHGHELINLNNGLSPDCYRNQLKNTEFLRKLITYLGQCQVDDQNTKSKNKIENKVDLINFFNLFKNIFG